MSANRTTRTPLQWTLLPFAFVGIGAVTTTVVAWGVSLRFQLETGEGASPGVFGPTIPAGDLSLVRACFTLSPVQEAVFWTEPSRRDRSYSTVSGWPALSLAAFRDTERFHIRLSPEHVLPLLPLPGFAIDTAFYGALAFCIWTVPGSVRRRIRRGKEGRCIACGYDLSGAGGAGVCPECGTAP